MSCSKSTGKRKYEAEYLSCMKEGYFFQQLEKDSERTSTFSNLM